MLEDVLRGAFALAHRRVALVFLDFSWKIVWAFLTAAGLLLAVWWMTATLRAISWEDTSAQNVNLMIAAALLRQFWNQKRAEVISMLFLLLSIAGVLWIVLAAFFPRKIVQRVCTSPEF